MASSVPHTASLAIGAAAIASVGYTALIAVVSAATVMTGTWLHRTRERTHLEIASS